MNTPAVFPATALQPFTAPPVLDTRTIRWAEVRALKQTLTQHFVYSYPGPIADLTHGLMVKPRHAYGAQTLAHFAHTVTPPLAVLERTDPFGNTVLEVSAARLGARLEFALQSSVTLLTGLPPLRLSAAEAEPFYAPTPLTTADARMTSRARELRGTYAGTLAFAAALNEWVFKSMRYGFGATDTRTPADAALAGGVGLCQDYAHIMVALCRAVGVPARYVSGHMLGEGGSHAWTEVLVPEGNKFAVYAFDPTNRRRPGLDYLTVAVGRDYHDVPPTAGTFSAPYSGVLSSSKQAGVTSLEYRNGEVLRA